jgi:flavodoxin I
MKVEKTLTSKALLYYSLSGNTKGLIDQCDWDGFDIYSLKSSINVNLENYQTIFIATSTWGNGVPPKPFFQMRDILLQLSDKRIGLFGSGNSHYEYFCGALDLLEEVLERKNKILFKFKFESYPTEKVVFDFKKVLEGIY